MAYLPDGLGRRKPVEIGCARIPIDDPVLQVAHEAGDALHELCPLPQLGRLLRHQPLGGALARNIAEDQYHARYFVPGIANGSRAVVDDNFSPVA